jgi:hypothetical protein
MPAVRDTYVNPLLTNIYLKYGGDQNFIAGKLFPTVYVDKETGLYFVADKENLRAPADARRGEFSRANRVTNTLSTASFTLEEKSLEHWIPERVMKMYSDPFDPKKNGTQLIKDKLLLDKELDLKATLDAGAGASLDTSASWATPATDIQAQATTALNAIQVKTGKKANVAVLTKDSVDAILKNTNFRTAVQYTSFPSPEALRGKIAEWLDVQSVYIADAINNTSKEGQADSLNYIWSDAAYFLYVNPNPIIEDTSAGYELKVRDLAYADEWYQQAEKNTVVRVTDFYDNKIVDADCIYRLFNTV